jgi:hypothetical protein
MLKTHEDGGSRCIQNVGISLPGHVSHIQEHDNLKLYFFLEQGGKQQTSGGGSFSPLVVEETRDAVSHVQCLPEKLLPF